MHARLAAVLACFALLAVAPSLGANEGPRAVVIPGTGYRIAFDPGAKVTAPPADLLKAVAAWIVQRFGLPPAARLPAVQLTSSERITVLHHTAMASDDAQDAARVPPGQREVVAVYDPLTATIHLPLHWTGKTPAELSMLVHEMVHHLQSSARLRFECDAAREELAYTVQDEWLRLFGRDLATDFDIDPFTLLVSVRCIY